MEKERPTSIMQLEDMTLQTKDFDDLKLTGGEKL